MQLRQQSGRVGLDHPIWTGRLRVIGQGDACFIRLEDTTTNELFAAGPYTPDGRAVETAIDSSRYFVLRVEDAGMHIRRNDAFDFNATLQAYLRHQRSLKEQASGKTATTTSTPAMDYRLKEGETIHINIQGMPSKTTTSHSSANTSLPLLPPPPSFTTPIPSEHVDSQDDDDFGDFMSA
ncbi:hypothetical protein BDF22DRAFT_743570 [Syncephalis plumigaleata]|nr:hypothetical protein BDF22DRAFT_743570 [Syncephalis plumigaleata]